MKMLLCLLLLLVLSPQSPESGVVYFYRLEEVGRFQGNKPKVYVDDKLALMLPESQFVGLKLPAGRHVVRMSGRRTETLLSVESGKTYFVRVERVGDGFSGMKDALYITDREQALFQMRNFKPLEDKNIKNKDLEVVTGRPD